MASLRPRSREEPLLRSLVPQVEELPNDGTEVLHEGIRILGVKLHVLAELLVLDEHNVRWEHHEVTRWVLELHRPRPRLALVRGLDGPLVLQELAVVLVTHGRRCPCPRAPEARAICVARAEAMRSAERHDLPVVEAHTVEDVAQVCSCLVRAARIGTRQPAVLVGLALPHWALFAAGLVLAAWVEGHLGATHLLDGDSGCEDPKVGIRDLRELLLDRFEKVLRVFQARIGTPRDLGLEAHRRTD
mmetsp:Transcript_78734/g.205348  ORF Transcript_78734/g.205348 Transcript_78734/m.205348 type:complete len:245 (+) Transcript_78734:317-1051(+)